MIKFEITIPNAAWHVKCYVAVDAYYVTEVIASLQHAGASQKYQEKAYRNMMNNRLDTGLCYSDLKARETILVIGKASSAEQYLNSIVHEIVHLEHHISEALNLDESGEEPCYLAGDIAQIMYPYIRSVICEQCLAAEKNLYRRLIH